MRGQQDAEVVVPDTLERLPKALFALVSLLHCLCNEDGRTLKVGGTRLGVRDDGGLPSSAD